MPSTPRWRAVPIVLIVLASTITLIANEPAQTNQGLKWTGDLDAAWTSAREKQRPLLLFVTMDGCVHCQRMKLTTLRDKGVQHDLEKEFVPVTLNAKDKPELVKRLRLRLFPTVVVIQPNGTVMESITGYQSPKQLREKLSATLRQASRETSAATQR